MKKWGLKFLNRIYSQEELLYCKSKYDRLAGRLAAKEATLKALGSSSSGVSWKDIQVINHSQSAPMIFLSGKAKELSDSLGVQHLVVSISHTDETAIAFVMGSTK